MCNSRSNYYCEKVTFYYCDYVALLLMSSERGKGFYFCDLKIRRAPSDDLSVSAFSVPFETRVGPGTRPGTRILRTRPRNSHDGSPISTVQSIDLTHTWLILRNWSHDSLITIVIIIIIIIPKLVSLMILYLFNFARALIDLFTRLMRTARYPTIRTGSLYLSTPSVNIFPQVTSIVTQFGYFVRLS